MKQLENRDGLTGNGWKRRVSDSGSFCWREYKCSSAESADRMKVHALNVQKALLQANPSGIRMQYAVFQDAAMTVFRENEWIAVTAETLAENLTCAEMDLFFARLFEIIGRLRKLQVHACVLSFGNLFMRRQGNVWEAALADLSQAWIFGAAPEVLPQANAYTRKDIARWLDSPKDTLPPEGGDTYALACMFQEALKLARKADMRGKRLPAVDYLHMEIFKRLKARNPASPDPQKTADLLKDCAASAGCMIQVRLNEAVDADGKALSIKLSAGEPNMQLSYMRWKAAQRESFTQFEDAFPFLHYSLSASGSVNGSVEVAFPRAEPRLSLECTLGITKDGSLTLISERLTSLSDPMQSAWIVQEGTDDANQMAEARRSGEQSAPVHPTEEKQPAVPKPTDVKPQPAVPEPQEADITRTGNESAEESFPAWMVRGQGKTKTEKVLREQAFDRPVNYIVRIEWLERARCRLTMVNGRSFVIHASDAALYGLEAVIQEQA